MDNSNTNRSNDTTVSKQTEAALQEPPAEPKAVPIPTRTLSRRNLVFGTGIGALAGLVGYAVGAGTSSRSVQRGGQAATGTPARSGAPDESITPRPSDSAPTGTSQAGVARPSTPQRNALFVVADIDLDSLPQTLSGLGEGIRSLIAKPDPAVLPDGAGDLTVLVGLGARALASLPRGATLGDTLDLPLFNGDGQLDPRFLGGDLLLVISASDPGVIDPAFESLKPLITGFSLRWADRGFRGPGEDGIARNPFGFHDGIISARGDKKLDAGVWIPDGPLQGGTVCVLRRFVLDTEKFQELDIAKQNAVFGRDKITGAPLSGGKLRDEGNITAKTEAGEFVIPADSHLRAAHPSFTGSELMLRRSYNFASAPIDGSAPATVEQGLLFMSFQNDVRAFVRTQQRMDDMDALMGFARPAATGAFAILPGFDAQRPLGTPLF